MIRALLEDMKCATAHKAYYSAVAVALMLPDICGKIQYRSGDDKQKYIKWFDKWVYKYFELPISKIDEFNYYDSLSAFNGDICYQLRCAYLHAGNNNLRGTPQLAIEFCVTDGEWQFGDGWGCHFDNGEYRGSHRRFNVANFLDGFINGTEDYLNECGDTNKCIPFTIHKF